MTKVTIGADPEIFLARKGEFISAHDLLPGTKWEPHFVKYGAIQVDGMAAEFNIDPASSEEEFLSNLEIVQDQLKYMIPEDVTFLQKSSVEFTREFMRYIPPENLQLGCEPDFNAYSGEINPRPDDQKLLRTAGGHIHVGSEDFHSDNLYETNHFSQMQKLVQIIDETVGVYSILWDKDDARRTMYGKAGAFRPKHYGVEYRSLSNSWIFNKERCKFVYEGVQEAVHLLLSGSWRPNMAIQSIINNSDRQHSFFKGNVRAEFVKDVLV